MVWMAEDSAPPVRQGSLLFSLLSPEIRQLWWLPAGTLCAGLGVWALLLTVTRYYPTAGSAEGVVFNYMGSLLLSVFPLLLAGSGLMGGSLPGRTEFWLRLPVSLKTVNLMRLLGIAVHVWPVAITWPLIISLLSRVYGPVSPWVIINSALAVCLGILLCARTRFAAVIIYLFLPVQTALAYFIPGGKPYAAAWAANFSSVWVGLGLLAACAGLAVYVLVAPPVSRKA